MDVAETDAPETDVPETKEGRDGGRPRRMSPRRQVCVFKHYGRLECMLLSDLLQWCVWVDESSGVCACGWLVGCAWVRMVEDGMAVRV